MSKTGASVTKYIECFKSLTPAPTCVPPRSHEDVYAKGRANISVRGCSCLVEITRPQPRQLSVRAGWSYATIVCHGLKQCRWTTWGRNPAKRKLISWHCVQHVTRIRVASDRHVPRRCRARLWQCDGSLGDKQGNRVLGETTVVNTSEGSHMRVRARLVGQESLGSSPPQKKISDTRMRACTTNTLAPTQPSARAPAVFP
jgi:hypothetical protein